MENKIITQNRLKSLVMWLGFIMAALLSVGIDWHDFQSWQLMWDKVVAFLNSPASIIEFCGVLITIANNPTNKTGF